MPPLGLSEDEIQHLPALARSRYSPHSIMQVAQIGLVCGAGEANEGDKAAKVRNRALQSKSADVSTNWSARILAAAIGGSKSTVHC